MEDVDSRITMGVGNIARYPADAVVNPTDSSLSNRDGVCGAIHRAAGRDLREACQKAAPCAEGEARITSGFSMQAEHIIHVVMPRNSRTLDDFRRIRRAYRQVFRICDQNAIERVNIPPVAMGPGGLTPLESASLALETAREWMAGRDFPRLVNFCCFTPRELVAYERAFEVLQAEDAD